MICNGWKARLLYGFALWSTGIAHQALVCNVSNTPEGMLIYHWTAMMVDYALLAFASFILYGRLSKFMQYSCLASMIVNFAGWVLYLAYAPPVTYNYAIGIISYVQYTILFTMGLYGTDRVGEYLFRGHDSSGPQLDNKKAKQ
jgi:hypothetical protein